MSLDLAAIAKDLITWGSAAKLVLGGILHKVWSKVVGAEKAAAAEIKKLEADAVAAAKKL